MGPAKSAGIACYNACGACGGFGAPNYYVLFRKSFLHGKTVFLSEHNRVQDEQLNDTLVRAVGPYLIGYLSDHYGGFAPPMYLLGAFNVLAGLMIIGALAAHDSDSSALFVAYNMYPKADTSKRLHTMERVVCFAQYSVHPTSLRSTLMRMWVRLRSAQMPSHLGKQQYEAWGALCSSALLVWHACVMQPCPLGVAETQVFGWV